jgi:hypothetical protein
MERDTSIYQNMSRALEYQKEPDRLLVKTLSAINSILVFAVYTMTKFEHTNSFAVLSVDHSDSNGSGYAEDESDTTTSSPARPETPISTPSKRDSRPKIDSEDRELVRRKDHQNVAAEDPLPPAQAPDHGRNKYNKPTPSGDLREGSPKKTLKRRRETDDLPDSAQPDH